MDKWPLVIVGLAIAASLLLAVACGPAAQLGAEPIVSLEELRQQTREQEIRLLPAIEQAASKAGPGIHPLVPLRPLSEHQIQERWVMLSQPNEDGRTPKEQGFSPADLRLPAEGVYTSEYSAEETYRRYLAAQKPEAVRDDDGCGPQAALDPEGAIVCSFSLQPEGRTDGLSFNIGPEYVTSEDRPVRDYPDSPGKLPTRPVMLVRVSGSAPTREGLEQLAEDDAFLKDVEVKPLRAGMGSPEWHPGLPGSAVWLELGVEVPEDTTPQRPLEVEAQVSSGSCERNLSDVLDVPGATPGQFVAGKPGSVRLFNNDTPIEACSLAPGRYDFKVMLRRGESIRFLTLPVELAPAPPK